MKRNNQNQTKSGIKTTSGVRAGRGECLDCEISLNNAYGWDCWEYTGSDWQRMHFKVCSGNPQCYPGHYGPNHEWGMNPGGDHCSP